MPKIIEIAAIDMTIYKFVLPLMRKLRQEGFEVLAAARDTGYMEKLEREGFSCRRVAFVRNLSPLPNLAAFFQLVHLLRAERPDAIHVHTPIASVLARFAVLFCRRKVHGRPLVLYTLHGLIEQPFFLFIEYLACRLTDFIFTVNRADREFLVSKHFIAKDRIKNLNSVGIDINKFRPSGQNSFTVLSKTRDKPIISFVGRLTKEKGIEELIEAFEIIKLKYDCRLLIAGPSDLGERDKNLLPRLKKKTQKFGDDVLWLGQREDIPEILAETDIFALPSYREGMCVSTLEAMAAGVPVAATDIRGIREEVTKDCGILVPPKDAAALAEAIESLLKDPDKAKKMGRCGRKRVLKYFAQERVVEAQYEVIGKYLSDTR